MLSTLTLLKSIHYSLNASLSKRAGRPNFGLDFPPKQATQGKSDARFGISTKNWTIETTLLLTFGPKTMIVGNVTALTTVSNIGVENHIQITIKYLLYILKGVICVSYIKTAGSMSNITGGCPALRRGQNLRSSTAQNHRCVLMSRPTKFFF